MIDEQTHSQTFKDLAIKYVQDVKEFQEIASQFPEYYSILVQRFRHHLKNSLINFAVTTKMAINHKIAKRNLSYAICKENREVWLETYKQKLITMAEI